MYRLMPAEKYRVQARVCAGMAEGSPSEDIKRLWLELARHYELAAEAVLPRRIAPDKDAVNERRGAPHH
jgi:hypothetical protein